MRFFAQKKLKVSRPVAHLFLFLVALIYGANYTIAKAVMDGEYIRPGAFIVLRLAFATALFFVFAPRGEKIAKQDRKPVVLAGLFGAAVNMLLFFYGLKRTSPIHASLIMLTVPVLVLSMALVTGKEVLTMRRLGGILLSLIGAVLIVLPGSDTLSGGWAGDIMIFFNATSYAIYLLIVKDLLEKYRPFTVLKWVFLVGLGFALPIGLPEMMYIEPERFTQQIWLATLFVLLFTTFFTYMLNVTALSVIPASTVSIYIYLQPVLATLIAVLTGKDQLHGREVLYFVMIVAGIYLAGRTKDP